MLCIAEPELQIALSIFKGQVYNCHLVIPSLSSDVNLSLCVIIMPTRGGPTAWGLGEVLSTAHPKTYRVKNMEWLLGPGMIV